MAQDGGATAPSAPPSMLATCRDCGDVVIKVQFSQVVRNRRARTGWYSFDCPMCARNVTVEAPEHLLSLLDCLGAGSVELEPETPPAPRSHPDALTVDDLLALSRALAATNDLVPHALAD